MQHTSIDFTQWHEKIKNIKVLVIGDLMLDKYISGQVNRISPEAPVPVLTLDNEFDRLGGAANVALNCASLGMNVSVAGIIGNDGNGVKLKELLQDNSISSDLILVDECRPTTCKTRFSSKHQQLMRVDIESTHTLPLAVEHQLIDKTLRYIQIAKPDIVILEDYDKGCLNANIIEKILKHCHHLGCITAVDPKKNNFLEYKDVTIFKPNLIEIRQALTINEHFSTLQEELDHYYLELSQILNQQQLLVTLSDKGAYYHNGNQSEIIAAKKRNIADVSGAGDTVIAVASMVYHLTHDPYLMTLCSNIAGGMVCEYPGVVPINAEDLMAEIQKHFNS